jgi:hypothetical protein
MRKKVVPKRVTECNGKKPTERRCCLEPKMTVDIINAKLQPTLTRQLSRPVVRRPLRRCGPFEPPQSLCALLLILGYAAATFLVPLIAGVPLKHALGFNFYPSMAVTIPFALVGMGVAFMSARNCGGLCCFGLGWVATTAAVFLSTYAMVLGAAEVKDNLHVSQWQHFAQTAESFYFKDGYVQYAYQESYYDRRCPADTDSNRYDCTKAWAVAPVFANASCFTDGVEKTGCDVLMIVVQIGHAEGTVVEPPATPCEHGQLCVVRNMYGRGPADEMVDTCNALVQNYDLRPTTVCSQPYFFTLGDFSAQAASLRTTSYILYGIQWACFTIAVVAVFCLGGDDGGEMRNQV